MWNIKFIKQEQFKILIVKVVNVIVTCNLIFRNVVYLITTNQIT